MAARARSRWGAPGWWAGAGAAWGLAGYAVLWGSTPVVVTRRFVVSAAGTVLLLPVRVVLWGIRAAEGAAGRTFDLSANHGWIGLAAAATGGVLALVAFLAVRASARRLRRAPG